MSQSDEDARERLSWGAGDVVIDEWPEGVPLPDDISGWRFGPGVLEQARRASEKPVEARKSTKSSPSTPKSTRSPRGAPKEK